MTSDEPGGDQLYHDPQLADFYDLENHSGRDDDFCLFLAANASSVLDLGCGTGRLASALASSGRIVVGVDPAAAMLNIARTKTSGDSVSWIEGDARKILLGRRFDLVLLTGNAFQVFFK
jgi:ubiquinone/menaquinone biosynthesis C-methylase UbiE